MNLRWHFTIFSLDYYCSCKYWHQIFYNHNYFLINEANTEIILFFFHIHFVFLMLATFSQLSKLYTSFSNLSVQSVSVDKICLSVLNSWLFYQYLMTRSWFLTTMRRITKRLLLFLFGVLFTAIYCEYLIYYVVALQVNIQHLFLIYKNLFIVFSCSY